jgi:hypothetical protein
MRSDVILVKTDQVVFGVILGAAMGLPNSISQKLAGPKDTYRVSLLSSLPAFKAQKFCQQRSLCCSVCVKSVLPSNQLTISRYVATTLLTVGVAQTIGSDDLLAAFAAGIHFASIFA